MEKSPLELRRELQSFMKKDPDQIPSDLIFPLLLHKDQAVKKMASRVLTRSKHPALFPNIFKQLPQLEPREKVEYILLIGELGDPAVALRLSDFLADSHPDVRSATVKALVWLGEEAVKAAVPKFQHLPREKKMGIIRTCKGLLKGDELILREAIRGEDVWIRREVIDVLARRKGTWIVDQLLGLLKDQSSLIRAMAIRALRNRNDDRIQPAVQPLLSDPILEVASAASSVIATIRSKK